MLRKAFTEEQEMFRESYRRFVEREIAPHAERWRENGIVDRDTFRKAGEQGFLLMWADEKYGGAGISDFRYEQIIIEENARGGDAGFFNTLHSRLVAPYIQNFGSEEQKARFLPKCVSGECILAVAMTEPDAGSDLAGMKTRAEDKGDYWLLNGSKTYISNGINCDLVIVAAKTDPENPRRIGLFLIERGMEGFERGRKLKKMGMHSQDTSELFFNNVIVPKANVLGDAHKGFRYLFHGLAEERLISATSCVAAAEAAFAVTKDFIEQRKAFGVRIADFQNTRFKMADMRAEIDCAQVFVDRCVELHNEGQLTIDLAAKAKLFASEMQGRVVDQCVQFHGGAGYMDEYPICRMYTDSRINRIWAGSSEIMRELIARSIFDAQ